MASPAAVGRRTQAQRSAETRQRLVDAAIAALIEHGYAGTTAAEVCRRAGVTRGALQHHFPSVAALLVEVLGGLYARLQPNGDATPAAGAEAFVRSAWQRVARPEFKAVIEIWLAARNDPALGSELAPAIAQLAGVFSPDENPRLAASGTPPPTAARAGAS